MDNKDFGFIPLGELFKVHYTDPEVVANFRDVYITSGSGKSFGINRSVLACLSPMCRDLFLDLYNCPLANADDAIHISTNFSDQEVSELGDFFVSGGKLPATPEDMTKVRQDAAGAFSALGLNLMRMSNRGGTVNGTVIKQEEEDETKYDAIHQQQSSDAMMMMLNDDYYPILDPMCDLNEDIEDDKSNVIKKGRGRPKKKRQKEKTYQDDDEEDEDYELPASARPIKKRKSNNVNGSATAGDSGGGSSTSGEKGRAGFFNFPDVNLPRDLTKEFQCERCSRGFTTLFSYRMHFHRHDMQTPDYDRAFICIRCMEFEAPSSEMITKHGKEDCPVKRHDDTGSKFTYWCAKCVPGERFESSLLLNRHFIERHGMGKQKGTYGEFACTACGKGWSQASFMNKHQAREGPFHDGKCSICMLGPFDNWAQHKEHLDKAHDGVYRYRCGHCGINVYDSEAEMKGHRMFCKVQAATTELPKHGEGRTSCTICLEVVEAGMMRVKQHLMDHHSSLGRQCPSCPDMFFSERLLSEHMLLNHTDKSRFACDLCDKSYAKRHHLRNHQLTHQAGGDAVKNFRCEVCGKSFKKLGQLNQHIKTHDENRKKDTRTRICYTCGKEVLAIYYSKHMRYKHGGANVKCTMCDTTFAHEVKLKAHMKNVHTYVTCDQCGVSVKSYALKPHILVHHTADASKPFVCQDCGKGFSTKQKYSDHRNIHTGEKPHLCKYCPRTFGDTSNRNKHIREAHHDQYMLNKLKKAAKQKEENDV